MKKTSIVAHLFLAIFLCCSLFGCKKVACQACKATGKITKVFTVEKPYKVPVAYYVKTECRPCKGRGEQFCTYEFTNTGLFSITEYQCDRGRYRAVDGGGMNVGQLSGQRCDACGGSSYVVCKTCRGSGTRKIKKTRYEEKIKKVKVDSLLPHQECKGTGTLTKLF